ncbi:hypothetical protein L2Y96_12535 [Luteibacter aegosomaticola]|uniref:hypothetical protein n=1 Tax=Luteibacter aegosomaticola TaxID=2911538 RepID=UPI001FF855EA|nr:hypothetical protein [Luteibacter aegosomaticola]UPG88247.1 hypothetical protein L2Y96_12535 [Luteibacter aegosomaticola]
MKLILDIELESEAFHADRVGNQLARILTDLASRVEGLDFTDLPGSRWVMYESPGQSVGEARIVY